MWNNGKSFFVQQLFLSVVALCCLLPMGYLLLSSVRDGSFAQYEEILLHTKEFYSWFWNTVFYTLGILILGIPVSILAAYGFAHHDFHGKNAVFFLYVILMLIPFQAMVFAQYLTLRSMHLLNTWGAVVLPCAYSPFGTFLLTQFMKEVDRELLEAARMDGATTWQILRHIMLPLCRPAIVSLLVLQLISCWSMVDQPLLFLQSENLLPLSLKLSTQTFGRAASAAGVIYAVVPTLLYLRCQDALRRGISLSSIK